MTKTLIKSPYKKQNLVDKLPQLSSFSRYEGITLGYKRKAQKVVNINKIESDTNKDTRYVKSWGVIVKNFDVSDQQYIDIAQNLEYFRITSRKAISENEPKKQEQTLYDKFLESELIGCCSVEEDLSTNYKQVLSDSLESKYDKRIVSIQEKLNDYPDWDREEQIKRNQKALKKLKERNQKTLQIDDQEACQRQEEFERFKQLIDQFRPQGSKLYSED